MIEKLPPNKHKLLDLINTFHENGIPPSHTSLKNVDIELAFLCKEGYLERNITEDDRTENKKYMTDMLKRGIAMAVEPTPTGNYTITEKGREYLYDTRSMSNEDKINYWKQNWIAILAIFISLENLVWNIINSLE